MLSLFISFIIEGKDLVTAHNVDFKCEEDEEVAVISVVGVTLFVDLTDVVAYRGFSFTLAG